MFYINFTNKWWWIDTYDYKLKTVVACMPDRKSRTAYMYLPEMLVISLQVVLPLLLGNLKWILC